MNYYLVIEGEVSEVNPCSDDYYDDLEELGAREDNNNEWMIAYATDEAEALHIADMYDREEIQMDNVWCQSCGMAHAAAKL